MASCSAKSASGRVEANLVPTVRLAILTITITRRVRYTSIVTINYILSVLFSNEFINFNLGLREIRAVTGWALWGV